ncbi:MAG: PIN domain-containing protein [Candidatus Diapherotrites archaeon]
MPENRFIMDSSAWIEYLNGTEQGKKVEKILNKTGQTVFTPNLVGAEVVSKIERDGEDSKNAIDSIENITRQPDEKREYFFEAGKLHAKLRKTKRNISFVDAILLILAEKNKAKIITKDYHLKGKNTIFLD